MGEVYRATDTKPGRDVALKVLPAERASSPERLERFRREAKALAALDHPGIVTVHSVEEADGVHFLTMQLVEGHPLDRLIPDGGLPVERILEIATGLAEALVAAHERGIVHRDLRPANVMVGKDGRVKVLDFGLARVRGAMAGGSGGSELPTDVHTREGVVLGTVPYMSPEQVSGRPTDHRTDVFSLGVMLYEMATGKRPFAGASAVALLSSILKDEPPPLSEAKPGLPPQLGRIVGRCLEKLPENRLQTASDLGRELRALRQEIDSGPAASPAIGSRPDSSPGRGAPWIVVLPFKIQGADPELFGCWTPRPAPTCGRRPTTATSQGRGSSRCRTTSPTGWWRPSPTPTASWCARWPSRSATGRSRS
jgi:eukaryotic-like serine/threonine-protein kinase